MGRYEGWPGVLSGAALAVLLSLVLLIRADTPPLTPAQTVATGHFFPLVQWELDNLLDKWPLLLADTLLGRKPDRDERLAQVDDYLVLARLADKEQDRLEGRLPGSLSAKDIGSQQREYLDELLSSKEALRGPVEEEVEAEISAVLEREGLASRFGTLFPPVDLRFGRPPTILVTSPRNRIARLEGVLLSPDLPVMERDRLESEILGRYDLSALVFDLAGLSTYPTLVSDLDPLREVLRTGAHEWLHAYFFFRPLGWNIGSSAEMFTINETAADLAGRELGDLTFARMGGDLSESSLRYLPPEKRNPVFTREMRETRLGVDELLGQGKVEEAEEYMKERWWRLALGGYRLRKLNQAYFAFRGVYAEAPGSVSPIGDQLRELRSLLPDVGTFVRTVAGVSSHREFLELLEALRSESPDPPGPDETSPTAAFSNP